MLSIAWDGAGTPVFMTGPAETVFEGEWALDEAPPMNDVRKN
jgi:diaminopimelate epimerase